MYAILKTDIYKKRKKSIASLRKSVICENYKGATVQHYRGKKKTSKSITIFIKPKANMICQRYPLIT